MTFLRALDTGALWYATPAEIAHHMLDGNVIRWRGRYCLTDMGRYACC